jgi:Ca-activated chloride channel family protein
MRFLALIGLMMLSSLGASAQRIQWESTSFNFGAVRDWDSPPAVFRLKNTGTSKLMFLPQHYGRDVQVVLPNRSIAPGETAEVTVHFYTPNAGSFAKEVEVYSNASDRPQRLTVRGNIVSLRNNALTTCPTFSADQPARSSDVSTITVVDRSSGEQVVGAQVELLKKNDSRATYTTNARGLVRSKLEMGRFTAQVQHEDYYPTVQEITLERRQGTIVLMLEPRRKALPVTVVVEPKQTAQPPMVVAVADEPVGTEYLGISINDQMEETLTDDRWDDTPTPDPKPPVQEPADLGINLNDQLDEAPASEPVAVAPLPSVVKPVTPVSVAVKVPAPAEVPVDIMLAEASYRPNNIVLLLDVSSSMRKDGKLDRLKAAAARLIGMMRPIDRLSVLAFNTSVFTVVPPTAVEAPEVIIDLIFDLEAEGYTSGVKGMKEAYAQLAEEWVEGGNNQLILVTDGMFNSSSFSEKDAIQLADDHADRGIILSVAGYSGDPDAEKMMKRIARRGKGAYLQLDVQDGAIEVLADEIKQRSRRPVAGQ